MIKIKKNLILFTIVFINIQNIYYFKINGNSTPKISIFLPIFNKESHLSRSLKSLQNQSLKDIEIVAVNDGSTDNTLKILKKLSKSDNRIKIINNDRNHGLLYARAMGILNSSGEYIMNLDPDDKLVRNDNLKLLYKTVKSKDLDLLVFKLKRVPLNPSEKILFNYLDDIQLNVTDDHITNKLIKKNIFLKAYDEYKKEIFSRKWNYHEDNFWSLLTKKYANSKDILNEFIYLYKRNNESLNNQKGNEMEIKNCVYRLKMFKKFNNINITLFKHYFYYLIRNYPLLKDKEFKNDIIHISFLFFNLYRNDTKEYEKMNHELNKISENKIIIFHKSNSYLFWKYLNSSISVLKDLYKSNKKKIIFINKSNKTRFIEFKNYIFPNDIIFLVNNLANDLDIKLTINSHDKNKIILF